MSIQLLINPKVFRTEFRIENFIDSDNIFALIKSGSFSCSSSTKSFIAKAGQGVLFKKNVFYHRKVIEPVTMYLFRYQSDISLFDTEHIFFVNQERICSTISMLEKLDSGIFKNELEYRKNLFLDIVTQYNIENSISRSSSKEQDNLIEKSIIRIKDNLHNKITLSEIAVSTGLSYIQFLRRFKMHTGMSPMDYIVTLRLQKAKSLLIDTNLPVKEISKSCGFENEYYFSNFFKKHTGSSPSTFRKMSI